MLIEAIFFIINKIIKLAGSAISVLYAVLPSSPFVIIKKSEFNDLIAQINYFLPVNEFIAILESWLFAIAIFYVYSIFARWIKAIE